MKKTVSQPNGKIRVLLADDHALMRDALRTLLHLQRDITVVGEADSGLAALRLARQAKPHVVLRDNFMPGRSGVEATCRLKQLQPVVKVIGLSLYGEGPYFEEMVDAGAS